MDTRQRTVVKAGLWTLIGLFTTAGVGLALTGSVKIGGSMAAINAVLGLVAYLIYERVWSHIRWGRH